MSGVNADVRQTARPWLQRAVRLRVVRVRMSFADDVASRGASRERRRRRLVNTNPMRPEEKPDEKPDKEDDAALHSTSLLRLSFYRLAPVALFDQRLDQLAETIRADVCGNRFRDDFYAVVF